MFGSTTAQTPTPKTVANIDANEVATNQSAVPVPYFCGRRRLALNYIAPVYNQQAVKITQKTGKDQTSTVGYNYFGDIATVICCVGRRVPLKKIFLEIVDSTIAWSGEVDRDSDFYEPILVSNYGQTYIYWGYYNQPRDSFVLTPIGALPSGVDPRNTDTFPGGNQASQLAGTILGHYDNHPNYRYQALLIGDHIKFGRDRTTVPNWEVEAARDVPWFAGASLTTDDRGVNPAGVVYELMTCDVLGLGMADAELYAATWNATKSDWDTQDLKISPLLTDQTDFKQFMTQMSSLTDCWLRVRGTQIELGYWKTGLTSGDIAGLPVLGSDDLTEEPDLPSAGYDSDACTECDVTFNDRTAYYHDDNAVYPNPGLQRQLGESRPVYLDQSWALTDAAMAAKFAAFYGQRNGRPSIAGTISVKVESIEAIEDAAGGAPIVGQLIVVDIASLSEAIVFRVTECEYPADDEGACKLTVENERAIWPSLFIQPPPATLGNFVVSVPHIANYRVVELPSGLTTSADVQLVILAQRPARSIVGFHPYFSLDSGVTYAPAPPAQLPSTFGPFAQLSGASGTTGIFNVIFYGVDLPDNQTPAQLAANTVLIFAGGEIMSFSSRASLGGGVYQINVTRGLYGTTVLSHATGAPCYFINRADLDRISSKNMIIGTQVYFKLVPFDNHQTFDLADATAFAYTIVGGAVSGIAGLILTTAYTVTSEGRIDSRISASWTYVGDQQVASFNVGIKLASASAWVAVDAGNDGVWTSTPLQPGAAYQVRVQAVNVHGQPSAWSAASSITSATTTAPPTPTGLAVTPGVQLLNVSWALPSANAIDHTDVFWALLTNFAFAVKIASVKFPGTSYLHHRENAGTAGYVDNFYWLEHVSTTGVASITPEGPIGAIPVVPAATQCATPLFVVAVGEAGMPGDADYRLQFVDTQGGATLYYSFDGATYYQYSATGNYKSPGAGSVLPTDNTGKISMAKSDIVKGYATLAGFLQSNTDQFWNNDTNSPALGGGGGSGGTGGRPRPPY